MTQLTQEQIAQEEGKGFYFYWGGVFKTEASDLLTAACAALLSQEVATKSGCHMPGCEIECQGGPDFDNDPTAGD